mgnify:CR=1 FL=1
MMSCRVSFSLSFVGKSLRLSLYCLSWVWTWRRLSRMVLRGVPLAMAFSRSDSTSSSVSSARVISPSEYRTMESPMDFAEGRRMAMDSASSAVVMPLACPSDVSAAVSTRFLNASAMVTREPSVAPVAGSADAFACCTALEEVVLPSGLECIGAAAFYECRSLTSVVIPDSVTSIGSSAFSGCSSLSQMVIPDSVTKLDKECFRNCTCLTTASVYLVNDVFLNYRSNNADSLMGKSNPYYNYAVETYHENIKHCEKINPDNIKLNLE